MRARPFPEGAPESPFLVRDALAKGISRERLRRSDIRRLAHGLATTGPEPGTLVERLSALTVALPGSAAWSHTTALELLGIPLPDRGGPDETPHVMWPTTAGRCRRAEVQGHRGLESRRVEVVDGLRVVDAYDSWCDLGELIARRSWSIPDLVVVGDDILAKAAAAEIRRRRDEYRWLDSADRVRAERRIAADGAAGARQELAARLASRVRPRGKRVLEAALPLLRHRAGSPMESRTRAVLVLDGLPEPELNEIINAEDGSGYLGEGDFVWRAQKVVGEYQGKHHANRKQRSFDDAKRAVLEDQGWDFIPIWAEDVYQFGRRTDLLRRLHDLLD